MECQKSTLLEVMLDPILLAFDCRKLDKELDTNVVIMDLPSHVACPDDM